MVKRPVFQSFDRQVLRPAMGKRGRELQRGQLPLRRQRILLPDQTQDADHDQIDRHRYIQQPGNDQYQNTRRQ